MAMRWTGSRGQRRFLVDVSVVVLGVLIALFAEQAVQYARTRQDVAAAEGALALEIADAMYQAYERQAVDPCLRARIGELAQALNEVQGRWTGVPLPQRAGGPASAMPEVYRPPVRGWPLDAWRGAIASGIVRNMPRDRHAAYSYAYSMIEELGVLQRRELEFSTRLAFLATDQTIDPASRINAIQSLAELDRINNLIVTIADQLGEIVAELGVDLRANDLPAQLDRVLANQRRFRGACVRTITPA